MAKVLLSSTSEDLTEHRSRVLMTLRRMEQDGIGMESFGALAGAPVVECKRKVDEADLIVLILAHRYGWVPGIEEGGDGRRSITRIEFDHARQPDHGGTAKPILVFLVDEKAEWTGSREQDSLLRAASVEEALKVHAAVKELQQFKSEISGLVRDKFSTPADLADRVGSAIGNWLRKQEQSRQSAVSAVVELESSLKRVNVHLEQGRPELALTYLESDLASVHEENRAALADKRLEVALSHLSLNDERLFSAALDVQAYRGTLRLEAAIALGKSKSQRSRQLWKLGDQEGAWKCALEAKENLIWATNKDPLNPDAWGTLGGLLKRLAEWAESSEPARVLEYEDAMLAAYEQGWKSVADAYPLLNYIEQRAVIDARRHPSPARRPLIADGDQQLRLALGMALKAREAQLGNRQDRPWAAFDLARGRHYLHPNVPAFLEDLEKAVQEARSVARAPHDRYMVLTTCDSLRALLKAKIDLDGLSEGIVLLEHAVEHDDWFMSPTRRPVPYLELELAKLHTALRESSDRQAALTGQHAAEFTRFIQATTVRWSREDEEQFQRELASWRKALEPRELKILRGMWKIFGAKTAEALTGGVPVDWDAAVELASATLAPAVHPRELAPEDA